MVYEEYDEPNYIYGLNVVIDDNDDSLAHATSEFGAGQRNSQQHPVPPTVADPNLNSNSNSNSNYPGNSVGPRLSEIRMARTPYQQSFFLLNNWSTIAETTIPLKASKFDRLTSTPGGHNYGTNIAANAEGLNVGRKSISGSGKYLNVEANIECRSREISHRLIRVNFVSLLINLALALVAFYFSFANNSSSTSAFAADCVLDFISSAIVLWRYYGDLNSVYVQAREQIACIYLGALFEISALGIIIKASSDIASGVGIEVGAAGYDLVYLAVVATIACTALTIVKCSLYRTIRDKSILLDVINTLISTIFAISIIMSQLLINVDLSFWYLDPILSIVLALFMAGFGLKVIHQNFDILRPTSSRSTHALHWLSH